MKEWSIFYGEDKISTIKSKEQLEIEIRRIKGSFEVDKPMIALINTNGDTMTIGLSEKVGFLNYVPANGEPPYYSSVGDKNMSIDDGINEFVCGELTEIPKRNCLPIELLIEGLKEYFETGKLPTNIEWEED